MEENLNDARNRRILRRGDPPLNPEDVAALKLLLVFERIPHLDILRLTVCKAGPEGVRRHGAPTRAARGTILLELQSADDRLYLRLELALAEVLATPVEKLGGWLCDEIAARGRLVSSLALKGGPPSPELVLAN